VSETTLADAQAWLQTRLEEGVSCPCCGQFARIYRRKLNSTMAGGLVWLVRESVNNVNRWVESNRGPRWMIGSRQLATIAHWGLIEAKPNRDEVKRTSGIWRPTELGIAFAHGRVAISKYIYLYDNKPLRFSDEKILIGEALGSKFSYSELMGGT